jgi:hypothetical protein
MGTMMRMTMMMIEANKKKDYLLPDFFAYNLGWVFTRTRTHIYTYTHIHNTREINWPM